MTYGCRGAILVKHFDRMPFTAPSITVFGYMFWTYSDLVDATHPPSPYKNMVIAHTHIEIW